MDGNKPRMSSFSRNVSSAPTSQVPGLKLGPNGTMYLSSGIADLDKILGGGFSLGSLVMVMEDLDAPHHMLLLRNFMSQGVVHNQPLLFASPAKDPRGFLGMLPSPASIKDDKSHHRDKEEEKGLRIAWQYKKYLDKPSIDGLRDGKAEFCNDFDLRKPLDRLTLSKQHIVCVSLQKSADLATFMDQCSTFLANIPRYGKLTSASRIAIQSLCAPHCEFLDKEWDVLSFLRSLKSMVRSANAVAVITFPSSLVPPTILKRWQHLADTLISFRAIPDDDKELAQLLTGYQDMLCLLSIHKVARLNTQVPAVLEATTYSMKLHKRRSLVLECLNQAPVDGSSGSSYATSGSCSSSTKTGSLDF